MSGAVVGDANAVAVTNAGTTTYYTASTVSGLNVTADSLTIDAGAGSIAAPLIFSGGSLALTNSSSASDWTVNGDGTGSVSGGGVASISFSHVTSISAGGSNDTLHGPAADTSWDIAGNGGGTVAGTAFSGFENLNGAPDNKDTFVLQPTGSLGGVADGGAGGYDTLVVQGQRDSIVSNPIDAHSGTLVIDSVPFRYAGLEPIDITATNVTFNGADIGLNGPLPTNKELLDKDLIKVGADPSDSTKIQIGDFDPTGTVPLPTSETHFFTISGTQNVTINGGFGVDTVEFIGDYLVPNSNLTVNAEQIKVDPGVKICLGNTADPCNLVPTSNGNITFNAVDKDNGISVFGITTTIPVIGTTGSVEIGADGSTNVLNGNKISLTAFAGSVTDKVSGAQTLSSGGDLALASVAGFAETGTVVIDTGSSTATCTYTSRDLGANKLKSLGGGGCTGSPADGASVRQDIVENGSTTGFAHAGLDLEYHASVNIHGDTHITAVGDVILASTIDVTASGKASAGTSPDKGAFSESDSYQKGDVVTDGGTQYIATADVGPSTTHPASDTGLFGNWKALKDSDAAVAATFVLALSKSQLSGTSWISSGGKVAVTSLVKTNVSTDGSAELGSSGAGIAVAVFVTDSQAIVDSTAATPITATSLNVSADTKNSAPTTAEASPSGQDPNSDKSTSTSSNSPTQGASTTVEGAQSLTGGGKLKVASTGGFVDSGTLHTAVGDCTYTSLSTDDTGAFYFDGLGGAGCTGTLVDKAKVYGDSKQTAMGGDLSKDKSKTADGNQNFNAALAVVVLIATTKAYIAPTDASAGHTIATSGGDDLIHAGATNVAAATGDAGNVKFSPSITGAPTSTSSGTLAKGTYYYKVGATFATGESLPSAEKKVDLDAAGHVVLNWDQVDGATGYRIYRGDASGNETFLAAVGNVGTYTDDGSQTPNGTDKPATENPTAGIGIGIAVVVGVIDTHAYLANNASITAKSVKVESTAPDQSSFKAKAVSGAGGSSVGVAGSIAVNVLVMTTSSDIQGTTAVALNGANLELDATSNVENEASATAKQDADGKASGVGASVAVNVVNDTTTAGVPNDAVLTGVNDLTIDANSTDTMTTTAEGGASAGTGSFALSAQVAIAISNVTTTASVGSGSTPLVITGKLAAKAVQVAKTTTTAKGDTKGGNAGIGLSLALLVANHDVESKLNRSLTAGGDVGFEADGVSSNDTEATASSAGAEGKKDGTQGQTDSSNKDVNQKADDNLAVGSSQDSSTKTAGKKTPEASSGENGGTKVTVAAAVAIAIISANALSSFGDALDLVTTGKTSFQTTEDADSTAKANASAVKGGTANIAAAVAINKITIVNAAVIGTSSLLDTHGLTLSALMNSANGGNGKHQFDSEAVSGAGEGKVGISGALALTIADVTTNAQIKDNHTRGPPAADKLNGSDLSLSAASVVDSTAKAKAKDDNAGTVGIGAGVAINIVNDTTTASIDSGATFDGTSKPKDVSLSATDTDTMTTVSEAGTTAKSGSDAAITPDVAISYPTVITTAIIGGDNTQSLAATGKVTLTATQDAKTTTTANAQAAGAEVSIGLALALAIVDDEVTAQISRNIAADGAVGASATGSSENDSESIAGAKGAKTKSDDTSGKDVNGKSDEQLKNANTERTDNTNKSASTTSTPKASTGDKAGGSGGTNVEVAAAVSINVITTKSLALFAGAITIQSGDVVSLKTLAETIATADAKGETVGTGSDDGIGVGVSINVVDITNKATTGSSTITATGLDVEALMNDKNNGLVRRWDDTAKAWVLVDRGSTLPYSPSNGDFFQLTKDGPMQTLVDGADQDVATTHELKVKSLTGFATTGSFTVVGLTGTCNYTGLDTTNKKFTGISGCTGTKPEDKAIVTSASGSIVNGDQTIDATHTNLNVASGASFGTGAGDFTGSGLKGTCHYTGVSSNQLTGVTGCTGTAKDTTKLTIVVKAGVYKWDDSTKKWVVQADPGHGVDLPGSPTADQLWRLAEHEIIAEANAGAGKTDVGIAGAVAINIVTNDKTDALIEGGSVTLTDGDLKLLTKANELDLAKADSEAEDAKSAGVGAAVALNILTSTETRSEAKNDAAVSGGKNVDVEAASRRQTETEVDMGASGDDTSVAPGVALVVLDGEATVARLGTSTADQIGSGEGTVTVKASHDGDFSAEAKSVAAGSTAVGVSIALNIVLNWSTLAEVDHDIAGTKVEIGAESATNTEAHADATTKGADKSGDDADKKKQSEIDNNPNTSSNTNTKALPTAADDNTGTGKGNSTTEAQGGDKNSGGVGVAASISLNWVVTTNQALIGSGVHVTATDDDVTLSAENSTQAAAKSTGLSASADGTHVAAAVGVDFDDITNTASVGENAVVSGNGVTIQAVNTGGKKNQLIAWGLAGAGGSSSDNGGASVAASIGVEVVFFHTEASVGRGAHIISNADVEIHAENAIGIQNMALSGAASAGGAGVGGAIVVNVFPDVTTEALVYSDVLHVTQIDAVGKVEVSAKSAITEADPIKVPVIGTLPAFSSVAVAAAASSGGAAVSGSVIVDVFSITTKAEINGATQINQHQDRLTGTPTALTQSLEVTADDTTSLTNIAGGVNFSSDSAGVGVGIDVDVIDKHVSAAIDANTTATVLGEVEVSATSHENFHELAVDVGGSSSSAAVDGSIIVVVLSPSSTVANVTATVHAGGTFTIAASDDVSDLLLAGGAAVSTSSAGVAVSLIVIDRQGTVDAGVGAGSDLLAGGTGLHVTATQHESMTLIAVGGAGGDSAGVAGSVIVNIQQDQTFAHIDSGVALCGTFGHPNCTTIASSAGVEVAAQDTTTDFSLAGTVGIGGTAGVGVGVVVDVFTKDTEARIGNNSSVTATGNVMVKATSSETFNEISVGGGFGGTASVNVQAAVPVISITTKAYVADGTSLSNGASITAGGSVGVIADETMTLNVIAGNISGGGSAAVGAAVSVPVVSKDTHSFVGNYAKVNAAGNSAIDVPTGTYDVHTVDMRFDPSSQLSGNTITFTALDDPGYRDGEEVFYDNGGGTSITGLCATTDKTSNPATCGVAHVSGGQTLTNLNTTLNVDSTAGFSSTGSFTVEGISGICTYSGTTGTAFQNVSCRGTVAGGALVGGGLYYIKNVGPHAYQLFDNPSLSGSPIAISGGSGENHRLVPTDQAGVSRDASNRFDPNGDVDYSGDWITVPYDLQKKDSGNNTVPLETGDSVVYSAGGGTPIGGLVDGGQYYAIVDSGNPHKIRLAANYCDAKGINYGPDGKCDNEADGSDDGKDANGNPVAGTVAWINLTAGATGRSHSIVPHGTTPSGDSSATGPRTITENTNSFRGVAVTANNSDNIGAFGISLGFSGTAAVNLAGVVNVENIHTSAHVGDGALINCVDLSCSANVASPNPGQSVRVAAGSQYYELEIAASLAIGGEAGVAVPITVRVLNLDTYGYVGNGAKVRAAGDISISANGRETIVGVTAGAGGGTVGVAGTVSVTIANVHTYACTGTPTTPAYACATGGATLLADGNVVVAANDDSQLVLITVAVAGGLVGVGLAVGVASLTKETEAYLGAGSFVVAKGQGGTLGFVPSGAFDNGSQTYQTHQAPQFRGLVVLATSSEDVFGLAPAVAGGFVGVAGGVGVTVMYVTTTAFIGQGSKINCQDSTCAATATGSNGAQSVNVSAVDYFKSLTIAGGIAGGFVGVAGGVDIGVADTSAQAYIGKGSYVRALGDVEVNGLSRKQTQTYALSAAGGFVGVAVAVSVWSVGTQTNSMYHDADGPFRGDWDSTTANSSDKSVFYKEGDVVTFGVNHTRYVAKIDHPLNDPSDTTEWDGPTDALHTTSGDQQDARPSINGADQAASGSSDTTTTDWAPAGSYTAGDEVNFNGHVWKAKNDVLGSAGDPQTDTADWAQEVGGYGSALSGTTSSASAPTWSNSASYSKGDRVTYDAGDGQGAHVYQAKVDISGSNIGKSPKLNPLLWTSADSQDATNARIAAAFSKSGGPQDQLDAASSGHGSIAMNAIAHVPNGGTTATIDSSAADPTTIVTGGHVTVNANDVLDVFGIAGAAAGGFVGVGASVLILNVKSVTDAGVANYATISAGGAVTVSAAMDEHSTPIGFAGGFGFVGVGAQVAIVNDTSTQNAHIDDHAAIQKAGGAGLTVSVDSQRDVHAYAIGVAAGAGAMGAAVAVVSVDGDATASIGDVAVGNPGPVNAVNVTATDHVTSDTLVISVAGGVFVGVGAAVAVIGLDGTLKASSGAHGSVGSGGFTVTADGTHDTSLLSVNVATGLGAVGVTVDKIENSRNTEAEVTGTGAINFTTPGAAKVQATASNSVSAFAPGGAFGGVGIAATIAIADLSGHTTTTVNGSITNATSILISSIADNTVTSETFIVGVSVVGISGALAEATIDDGANIQTTVGSGSTLSGSGTITVEAKTRNDGNVAKGTALGGTAGLLAAGTFFVSIAEINGNVEANMNGHVTGGSLVDVNANATNDAEAHTFAGSISLGGALAGSVAYAGITSSAHVTASGAQGASITGVSGTSTIESFANNTATTTAEVGSAGLIFGAAVSVPTASIAAPTNATWDGSVTGGTGFTVQTEADNTATVSTTPISAGLFAAAAAIADGEITNEAQSTASVGQHAVISTPGKPVSVKAKQIDSVDVKTGNPEVTISILFSLGIIRAKGHDRGGSHASFDGELTDASTLTVQTDATRGVNVHLFSLSFSAGVAVQSSDATATIGDDPLSVDEAFLGSHTNIHSTGTSIAVNANRGANATSESDGGAGALLGSGVDLESTSDVEGTLSTHVDGGKVGTNAGKAGGLSLRSEDTSNASAETTVGSGAIGFTAGAAKADATASPTVKSWIGNNVSIVLQDGAGHDVDVKAWLDDAEADSNASAYGGALGVRIGAPDATVTSNPVVQAWIGTGTTIVAGGSVKVDAQSKSAATGPPLTDNIVGIVNDGGTQSGDSNYTSSCSTAPDTVCFIKHGLVSGDSVLYYPNGGSTIGGLHADQTVCTEFNDDGSCKTSVSGTHVYNVIVVDGNDVRLGDTFTGASVYNGDGTFGADSVKTGVMGIDANRSMIRFSTTHDLESGDAVIYRTSGSSISNDFVNGAVLYVRVIDPYTIELYTSANQALATATPDFFGAGSVCDPGSSCANQIVNGDASLTTGTRVTYKNGDPIIFSGTDVNINEALLQFFNDTSEHTDQKNIYLSGDGGFSEGQPVIYQAGDTVNQIGNLSNGTIYYVHVVDGNTIQLATSYCLAVGYSSDHKCTTDPTDTDASKRVARNVVSITRPSLADAAHPSNLQSLRPAPINGLTDGYTYVVTRVDSTHIAFQGVSTLSPYYGDPTHSALGARATIGGDNNPNDIFSGGNTQAIFKAGAALKTASGSQELDIRLTGTLDTRNELLNLDTSSLRAAHPPVGDGKSSASGTGGGGSIGDVSEPSATVNISPNIKAYVAANTINIGGDFWITTFLNTNTSAYTENGSGGLVSIPSVDSEIGGTDTNVAGIGDFSSINSIADDASPSTAHVDASNMTITAGGNVKIDAHTSLNNNNDAKSDSGGGFDDSNADAHTNLTDTTWTAIGKNANVTALTLALNAYTGGNNHSHAKSVVIALFGSSSASPTVTINSKNFAILDGENAGTPSTGVITALNGVDVRAHHESLKASADGGHLCICLDVHFGSDGSTNVTLKDLASGHEGVTVVTGPRITLCSGSAPSWPPLETNCSTRDPLHATPSWLVDNGDKYLALYVQGEAQSSDGSTNNVIHWNSDVVIYSGPSPLLIIDANGNVLTAVNIAANGLSNPEPGNALSGATYIEVNDLVNMGTGDIYMQAHNGTIDGGNHVPPPGSIDHFWGTFTFHDNWQTVTIINHSARDLVIDDIDPINRTARPKVTEDTTGHAGADAKFAIVRQVDPTLITITNDHSLTSGHPNLVIDGTINNPIGETDITNQFGPISATTIRGGTSSVYSNWSNLPESPPHSSLIRTNILHLVAGTSIGAANSCVYNHDPSSSCSSASMNLCLDTANPCVNIDLVVWANHPQLITTVSG
ncbi:MAG TPA: hypothetical protein VFJ93_04150, partial [Gaiellaceae bacterium]|nr:hypothetical protein [Gaiellaceae bacterium]